jgi:hypothetical protein
VGARLDGIFIYNVADEEQQLRGGQALIFKAFVQSGSDLGYYATKVPHSVRRRGRGGLTSEAAVYFDIEPASCVHLALLGDVVPHPARPEAALLGTEWAEHGSLEQWIRSERQRVAALPRASRLEQQLLAVELTKTLRRTLELAMQMLRGLARLHEGLGRGGGGGEQTSSAAAAESVAGAPAGTLVHQDVKPANVLLFAETAPAGALFPHLVKLADDGLCSDEAAESLVGSRVGGTKAHMAPAQAVACMSRVCGEQAGASEAAYGLWAFGLVVAEMADEYKRWLGSRLQEALEAAGMTCIPTRAISVIPCGTCLLVPRRSFH